jgi:E3 ubiquitin-protein ligase UBR1
MSFFFSKLNSRERAVDGLARLRYALETMPTTKKYQFTSSTRTEVLTELYNAFWGPYSNFFLPNAKDSSTPLEGLLSEIQRQTAFGGNGKDGDPVVPGRVCGRVFQKGEACYRCKLVHYVWNV